MLNTITLLTRRILVFLLLSIPVFAHEKEPVKQHNPTETAEVATQQPPSDFVHSEHQAEVTAGFDEFPNLHPLVVHVPIMMLVVAAILQLISFFVFREAFSWIVLIGVLTGFVGAYASAVWTHPHVSNLPEHVRQVYETHETYANWTLWLSGIATVLKILSHFVFQRKAWAEMVVAAVLLASAYTVSMAGHHGAQLVFIEGVGPQGNYLHSENGHSH